MAITQSSQQILTRAGSDEAHDIVYLLQSSSADIDDQVADVVSWITNSLPSSYLGQEGSSVNYQEVGSGWWSVTARYSTKENQTKENKDNPEIDEDPDWRFSIATESRNIKQSMSLVSVTPSHNDWNPFLSNPCPIGYDGKDVQGVDLPVPVASWDETYYFDPANVTQAYRLICLGLVGKVNNASFRGAATRQVLLQSVEGNKKGADPWIVTFSFLYRGNHTATYRMTDGSDKSVSTIGHQYVDAIYGKLKIGNNTFPVPKIILVHDVFELGDFSLLGIGS